MLAGMDKFKTIPNMMIARIEIEGAIGFALEAGLTDELNRLRDEHAELGNEIREMLQQKGFTKDCEIDHTMEMLAREAAKAKEKLTWYIYINSPEAADRNQELGLTRIREYQDKNPSPIRPDRRH